MQTLKSTAIVTSSCNCEELEDETGETSPALECWGDCSEVDLATDMISEWLTAQNLNPYEQVIIRGQGLGWRSLDGWKFAGREPLEILECLYLRGDFTIRLELSGPFLQLRATRSSHDEPTGATFYFTISTVCGYSECEVSEGLVTDEHGVPLCDWHA
jgi:hypothetical protein